MKLSGVLGILSGVYESVGSLVPYNGGIENEHGVKEYGINVYEEGATTEDIPYSLEHTIVIRVRNEGDAEESATINKDLPIQTKRGAAYASATLEDKYKIFENSLLRKRVASAMSQAAYDIINEDGGTANHSQRLQLAMEIMYGYGNTNDKYLNIFMRLISLNATVQTNGASNTTDNDLQYIVNSNIDSIATTLY